MERERLIKPCDESKIVYMASVVFLWGYFWLTGVGDNWWCVLWSVHGDESKMANRVMGYVICGYNSVDNLLVSHFSVGTFDTSIDRWFTLFTHNFWCCLSIVLLLLTILFKPTYCYIDLHSCYDINLLHFRRWICLLLCFLEKKRECKTINYSSVT